MAVRQPRPTCIDFETFPVRPRPFYPPVPVGVSIQKPGKAPRYYAWGHPTGNNCTWAEAREALVEAYANKDGVLCHHGKFDLDVAEVHFGLPMPSWEKCHDTLFLLFLDDPHQIELGLKPAAHRLLGLAPDEKDVIVDWLVEHQPIHGVRLNRGRQGERYAGAYVAFAPGELVGKYANGDTDRTSRLFNLLWKKTVVERDMGQAYDTERELQPILLEMERQGVPVDLERLRTDVSSYSSWLVQIDLWIRRRLKLGPEVNLDSGDQLAAAMIDAGKADPALMGLTAGGKIATNKEALKAGVTDKVLAAVLKYRSQLKTCLGTFMEPWLAMAETSGGLIYTNWNQVKAEKGGGSVGTRTGRLSSTPNFQNIPKEFEPIFQQVRNALIDALTKHLPKCPWPDLPPLPMVRGYVISPDGEVLCGRDYSQQEPRILAHFEDGSLCQQYLENPWLDFHDNAKEHLERITGRTYQRKPVKNINLGLIYGQGVGSLAIKNESTVEDTIDIRDKILAMYPGLKGMYQDMKRLAKANEPFRTWGGREVYCEPSKIIKGRIVSFDYKMVNYLIQGSAADCTKRAIIRLWREIVRRKKVGIWRLLLNVHDELVGSAPKAEAREFMAVLKAAMEGVEFDVPMLSEGEWGTRWVHMNTWDKKGKEVDVF